MNQKLTDQEIDEPYLLLKPLSEITDEHAIILNKISWPDWDENDHTEAVSLQLIK